MGSRSLPTSCPARAVDVPEALAAGERWFLESGIMEPAGGVARYHLSNRGENARVSTEITGYAVSCLLDLHARTGSEAAREGALRTARFLCRHAWDPRLEAMPFEWSSTGDLPEFATYFFDNGIIVRGLLRAWRATDDQEFLQTAAACGEAMRRDFPCADGLHPILDLPAKTPRAPDARWSRNTGCYQLKAALGWLDLAAATGDDRWTRPFDEALARALRTHRAFPGGEPGARTMDRLHAYGYFLEALLPRAGESAVRAALSEGIERTGSLLRQWRGEFERSDVPAQLLRVRLWADALGAVPLDARSAAEEAAWAARYFTAGPKNVDGSFCFGSRAGELLPFANPVSTAFCLQALALYDDFKAGRPLAHWSTLV
jgi:hypothetical protein